MAKIEYYNKKIELPETKKIDSITGQKFKDNYAVRLQRAAQIARENMKTQIKADEIVIGKSVSDD